jgi:hypothetical protein
VSLISLCVLPETACQLARPVNGVPRIWSAPHRDQDTRRRYPCWPSVGLLGSGRHRSVNMAPIAGFMTASLLPALFGLLPSSWRPSPGGQSPSWLLRPPYPDHGGNFQVQACPFEGSSGQPSPESMVSVARSRPAAFRAAGRRTGPGSRAANWTGMPGDGRRAGPGCRATGGTGRAVRHGGVMRAAIRKQRGRGSSAGLTPSIPAFRPP